MRPQLIIDCGGRVLSALLVTGDGELVPCSQEIRQVATRHASLDILFEPRIVEDRDFSWEDALETLSKTGAPDFFRRARRIGLRRPWDPQASAEALPLVSPLTVLSSPAAFMDPRAGAILPGIGAALLDALLEPALTFVTERRLSPRDVEPVVVLPAQTGHRARMVLQKLFRRRGFRGVQFVRREIAAAMSLISQAPCACIVVETSETDLHLHRVILEGDPQRPHFRTASSATLAGLGWNHWSARIAEGLRTNPSAAFKRSLTTLLTGSPDSLPPRITHGALQNVLDEAWTKEHALTERLQETLAALDGRNLPLLFAGEIFSIEAIRRMFGTPLMPAPILDQLARNVACALRSQFVLAPSGSLRVNTCRGEAVELLPYALLPAPGEACHVDTDFRLAGDGVTGRRFLLQLQWGTDRAPEGNAPLCAIPLELLDHDQVRLNVNLRCSRGGSRLNGTLEVRMPRHVVVARARFAERWR